MNDNDTLADDLRNDSLALMKLLADEKHKSEALAASLAIWRGNYQTQLDDAVQCRALIRALETELRKVLYWADFPVKEGSVSEITRKQVMKEARGVLTAPETACDSNGNQAGIAPSEDARLITPSSSGSLPNMLDAIYPLPDETKAATSRGAHSTEDAGSPAPDKRLPAEGCPKCGGEQLCPCANCADRNAGKVTWKWDDSGEIISCGHCGWTAHADEWMDLDMERFLASQMNRGTVKDGR